MYFYIWCECYFYSVIFFILDVIVYNYFVFVEILQLYIYSFIYNVIYVYKYKLFNRMILDMKKYVGILK